ncbi:hypothetical protein BDP27DRAFT_1429233 [Rhodocollybia butyracea]|uniref:F-box domain-containing protein n=1 Tax=Rhodocollybia butyracea TaxID=206335 RepID=A0A9P5PD72_9AGAR|nr:hypothetical protein BDP27DRAFT_1429233 [Rhodocollybia butyracea]
MASLDPPCSKFLSPAELAHLENQLRLEFGPSVVSPERAAELKEILALADQDIERLKMMCVKKISSRATRGSQTSDLPSPIITYLPAMAISSVCSRWRIFALSSPNLWANLSVEVCPAAPDQVTTLVGFSDTVARYLERSGDWPLRLALNSGYYSLTNHMNLSELYFPLLAELDINTSERDEMSSVLDCFEHAPRLCALATTKVPTSKAPYHQLRHLKLWYIDYSYSKLAEILHRCTSVESLELEGYKQWKHEDGAHYLSRNITSLTIGDLQDFSGSILKTVFLSFDLPSLNVIVLEGQQGTSAYWPMETFIPFISRSSCMITTFTLRKISVYDSDLIVALQVMPSLLNLQIVDYEWCHQDVPITSKLISSLIQDASTSISLVPKLHTLRLVSQNKYSGSFDDSAFVSMVELRWFRPGSDHSVAMSRMGRGCLRSVVLKLDWREVDAEVYKPLRILEKEGLRVVVAGINGIQV